MRHVLARCAAIACVLVLSACSGVKAPADIDAAARLTFDQVRKGDDAALFARATPEVKSADPAVLAQMRTMLPDGEPSSSKVTVWNVTAGTDGQHAKVEHVYEYGDRAVVASTALARADSGKAWRVEGFHISPLSAEQRAASALSLTGKTPAQYGFLAAAMGTLVLMVVALVAAIRAPALKRKWLWGLLAFAGLFGFQMNWTTGEIGVQLFTIQFIGLGMVKDLSPLAPWLVKFTLPVGAVLVLLRVAKARRDAKKAPAGS